MTLNSAQRITQLRIERTHFDERSNAIFEFTAYNGDGSVRVTTKAREERRALEILVEMNWQMIRQEVLKRCRGRCEECGRRKAITVHHKVFRSHGRVDSTSNCEAVCSDCHQVLHGLPTRGF